MNPSPKTSLVGRIGANKFARWAPYLALGPISGPLTAAIVFNFRGGRPFLASLYGTLLASWLFLAPIEVVHLLPATLAKFI